MVKSCKKCRQFFMDGEGWELPQFDYPNCKANPSAANLKSFPFNNTSCPHFTQKEGSDELRES